MRYARAYIGLCRGASMLSGPIAYLTAPLNILLTGKLHTVPSHVFIGFVSDDNEVYFEALESTNGFMGPDNISKLKTYLADNPKAWATRYYLDLLEKDVQALYEDCMDRRDVWTYAHTQLIKQYFYIRFGIKFKESPDRVTCSEAVARLLKRFRHYDLPYYAFKNLTDYITPWDFVPAVKIWNLESSPILQQ